MADQALRAAIVQDAEDGRMLMLAWMDEEALRRTRETGEAWFWSRSRRELWHKGETSGNTLSVATSEVLEGLDGADVYFAHSYGAANAEAVVATVVHDAPVVAAVERGALAGVQFHPERSGAAGARILDNVLRWSSAA